MSSLLKRLREVHEMRDWEREQKPRLGMYANPSTARRYLFRVWKEKEQQRAARETRRSR